MKNPTDHEELANIFNKKHKEHMDDPSIPSNPKQYFETHTCIC